MSLIPAEALTGIFAKDAVIRKVIESASEFKVTAWNEDIYLALCDCIISQQISAKVATVIFKRYCDLFPEGYPSPEKVMEMSNETLRSAGLSAQKIGYLRNLAEFHLEHNLNFHSLLELSDEEIIAFITQVKGIGKWTVEMLIMFALHRTDVLPLDDLVIRQQIVKAYQLTEQGKELRKKMTEIAENWRPFRSYVCMYLWRWKGE
ncbi:MAG: DNA-3-methyladenine glycosylase 2 family protein [Bacteroidia bacterium]|nr:DNA-3-methyladenine glycosylase 2 family protein [Bacteroidia bacterium]